MMGPSLRALSAEERRTLSRDFLGLRFPSSYAARREAFIRCCLIHIPAFSCLLPAPEDMVNSSKAGNDALRDVQIDSFLSETPELGKSGENTDSLAADFDLTCSTSHPVETSVFGKCARFDLALHAFECLRDGLKVDDLPPCAPVDFIPSLRPPPREVPISNMIHARVLTVSEVPSVGIVVSVRVIFSTRILRTERRLSDFERLSEHLATQCPDIHEHLPELPRQRNHWGCEGHFREHLQIQQNLNAFLEATVTAMKLVARGASEGAAYNVDVLDFLGVDSTVRFKQHRSDMRLLLRVLKDWPSEEDGDLYPSVSWLLEWDNAMQSNTLTTFPCLSEEEQTREASLQISKAECLLLRMVYCSRKSNLGPI